MRTQVVSTRLLNPEALLKDALVLELGYQVGDFGCGGAGYFTIPAARMVGSKGKVYAVDVLQSALDGVLSKARLEGLINVETVWSDLEKPGATNIPEGTLDRGLLINIMFQSRQNQNILNEVKRLLKSGGKLLVVDWKVQPTLFGPPIANRMQPSMVEELARKVGFKPESQFEAGPYHYGFILVKP